MCLTCHCNQSATSYIIFFSRTLLPLNKASLLAGQDGATNIYSSFSIGYVWEISDFEIQTRATTSGDQNIVKQ